MANPFVHVPERAVIRAEGEDALAWLDDLLTNGLVARLASGPVAYAALLSPQGKVLTDLFVWRCADALLLDTPAARAEDLLRRLTLFRLRKKVTLTLDPDLAVLEREGDADWGGAALCAAPDPRLAMLGARAIIAKDALEQAVMEAPRRAPQEALAARVALGVPDLAIDAAPEEVFALEGLLEELNGVDFKKGCFVGQENVSRMKRRATTRRKFCPVAFEGSAPEFGQEVRAGEVVLGSVRSAVAGRALALLRLDRALEAEASGGALTIGARRCRLDPPAWLILPSASEDSAAGS